jgi:DNA modification methylase
MHDIASTTHIVKGPQYRDMVSGCIYVVAGFPREWTVRREMVTVIGLAGDEWVMTRAGPGGGPGRDGGGGGGCGQSGGAYERGMEVRSVSESIVKADCLDFLRGLPEGSVDLVFGSPPYEEARLYLEDGENLGISRKTDAWVAWMVEVFQAAQRACKGLVAFVVAGQTRNYKWSAGPALLMAELHRAGMNLRNPPIFSRVGIPGSGGPDWLRGDYEWIICTTRPGQLPWSDNTACGHAPKWGVGGECSYRDASGKRKNAVPKVNKSNGDLVGRTVETTRELKKRKTYREGGRAISVGLGDGRQEQQQYIPPDITNPGNVIHLNVGGGIMGNDLCHENEAPFPEKLAEFFILSFCPPGGIVADCFSGSGTTASVAKRHNRNFTGCDLRQSQVDLALKRLDMETPMLFS